MVPGLFLKSPAMSAMFGSLHPRRTRHLRDRELQPSALRPAIHMDQHLADVLVVGVDGIIVERHRDLDGKIALVETAGCQPSLSSASTS